jgi:hypothetical protein
MEFVGMRGREIERGDQQTPGHGILLRREPEAGTGFRKGSCTRTSRSAPPIRRRCRDMDMRRREFIEALAAAAATWPLPTDAQTRRTPLHAPPAQPAA